jgi:hypothetical protein
MQDRVQEQAPLQMASHTREEIKQEAADQKDLAALWAVGVLFSLLLALAGLSWSPARYEARTSSSVDPMEAQIENSQNRTVADAINEGKIEYHPAMEKLVRERPLVQLVVIDLIRLLLFPTAPIVIVSLLIRKTVRQAKKRKTIQQK